MKTKCYIFLLCTSAALGASAQYNQIFFYVPTNDPWPIPPFYDEIVAADFDGDGVQDILTYFTRISVADPITNTFSVNNFTNISEFGVKGITAADLTGDALPDIVMNTEYSTVDNPDLHSVMQVNSGSGDLLPVIDVVPTSNGNLVYQGATNQLTHSDMDGDGNIDIVRTSGFGYDGEYYSAEVQVLRNTGNLGVWQFFLAADYQEYQFDLTHMVLGDLTGDGLDDIVYKLRINDFGTPGNLMWVENNSSPGAVNFAAAQLITPSFRSLAIKDMDGDGLNDIIGFNELNSKHSWIPNLGNGTFGEPQIIYNGPPINFGVYDHLVAEDVNGDGHADVVIGKSTFLPRTIYVMINDGQGQFTLEGGFPALASFNNILVADITGNGIPEIIASVYSGIYVFSREVDCTPSAPTNLSVAYTEGGVQLSWTPFAEAVRCRVQSGTDINGPYHFINVTGNDVSQTFIPANALSPGTTYGWRVRCFCAGDPQIPGPWSEIYTGVYNPTPSAPALVESGEYFSVMAYPNPASADVRLTANKSEYKVSVIDLQGRTILERFSSASDLIIEKGSLPAGLYILRFQQGNEVNLLKLLIHD